MAVQGGEERNNSDGYMNAHSPCVDLCLRACMCIRFLTTLQRRLLLLLLQPRILVCSYFDSFSPHTVTSGNDVTIYALFPHHLRKQRFQKYTFRSCRILTVVRARLDVQEHARVHTLFIHRNCVISR